MNQNAAISHKSFQKLLHTGSIAYNGMSYNSQFIYLLVRYLINNSLSTTTFLSLNVCQVLRNNAEESIYIHTKMFPVH
jgi:broad specificity polyphosphatase/5'/3'-nucleotidase SurE